MRAATRDHHERIDRLVDLQRMGHPEHYRGVLQVFAAFLDGWEPAAGAALPSRWRGWLQARSRRAFLAQDLHRLHIVPRAGSVQLPALATPAAAWGSVYVMEGSALGGQVITRHLAELGLHTDAGAAYFHGWGAATGAMWREFRDILEREVTTPGAVAEACHAAGRTFDALSALFESIADERAPAA